jgi:hypothetical protein
MSSRLLWGLIDDAVDQNDYDRNKANVELLYRRTKPNEGGSFNYYSFAVPWKGQEGLRNANAIIQGLPIEFHVNGNVDDTTLRWTFTDPLQKPQDNAILSSLQKHVGKKARKGKLKSGKYKRVHAQVGHPTQSVLFNWGTQMNLNAQQDLLRQETGAWSAPDAEKRFMEHQIKARAAQSSWVPHETIAAGMPQTHPPFVGSIDEQLNELLGPE